MRRVPGGGALAWIHRINDLEMSFRAGTALYRPLDRGQPPLQGVLVLLRAGLARRPQGGGAPVAQHRGSIVGGTSGGPPRPPARGSTPSPCTSTTTSTSWWTSRERSPLAGPSPGPGTWRLPGVLRRVVAQAEGPPRGLGQLFGFARDGVVQVRILIIWPQNRLLHLSCISSSMGRRASTALSPIFELLYPPTFVIAAKP